MVTGVYFPAPKTSVLAHTVFDFTEASGHGEGPRGERPWPPLLERRVQGLHDEGTPRAREGPHGPWVLRDPWVLPFPQTAN